MGTTVVAGVRGVGVSSVCTTARKELGEAYELINFGDVMLEQAATQGLATDRSALGELSTREIGRLQRRAGEYVADRTKSQSVILSTHLAVETTDGVLPGLPDAVLSDVSPDRFVLVEATADAIAQRRADDTSIRRVQFRQDLHRAAAMEYAIQQNAPVELLTNDTEPETTAAELVELLTG